MIEEIELWDFRVEVPKNIMGVLDRYATTESIREQARIRALNPVQCVAYTDGTKLNIETALLVNATGLTPWRRDMAGPPARHVSEAMKTFDFTHAHWGFSPRELSALFIEKEMPHLSAFDAVRKLPSRLGVCERHPLGVESALAREALDYTESGADLIFGALRDRIDSRGGEVLLEAPFVGLEAEGGRIVRARLADRVGRTIEAIAFVISTVPLLDLIRAFGPLAPQAVRDAAEALLYKPITILGMVVRREQVLDALCVYFRDRDFHRISEPKLSGLRVSPPHDTILVVELTNAIVRATTPPRSRPTRACAASSPPTGSCAARRKRSSITSCTATTRIRSICAGSNRTSPAFTSSSADSPNSSRPVGRVLLPTRTWARPCARAMALAPSCYPWNDRFSPAHADRAGPCVSRRRISDRPLTRRSGSGPTSRNPWHA